MANFLKIKNHHGSSQIIACDKIVSIERCTYNWKQSKISLSNKDVVTVSHDLDSLYEAIASADGCVTVKSDTY